MIRTFDFTMDRASDLDFFALLARHPSLAAAAQELGLSPPAVSRRLAQLETRLGARLMNRTTRRLSLTPEGERYLEEGKRILRDIESLEHSLGASRDVPRGLLRVNASFGFGRRLLGPAISDFVRRYPEMEIQLHLSDRPLNLVAHGLDLGIRFGEPPDARILARPIARNRRVLCATPTYLEQRGRPRTPRELQQHACIVIRENDTAYNTWTLVNGEQQENIKVRGPLSANHGEIAVDWALDHHGILLRSEWDIAPYLASGQLEQVLPEWAGIPADIYAVYPQRLHLAARLKAFVAFLQERLGNGELIEAKKIPA